MVGEAVNGQEAITRAAELRPDVILMDVRMPVLDGLQATRQIAAVTAVAAGTAAAGALLSVLRERSGSLAARVLVHLAANCTAPLASALARSLDARASPPRTPPGPGRNAGRTRARSRAGH